MITYAKGASVLKQLVAWVGLDPFLAGLRQYFKDHAYGNSEFSDLLAALEKSSGRELDGWAQEWLQTAGVNTLDPEFELDDDGTYTLVRGPPDRAPPTGRRCAGTASASACTTRSTAGLVRRTYLEIDVDGELDRGRPTLVGEQQPDLLLLNDGDLAYAKIRLDERSLATVVDGLSRLDDSLARALCWGAAWDMTRDAEMRATDFVDAGARQHRHRDRRLGRQPDPGLRRLGGQRLLRARQPGVPQGHVGARPARACSRRPSRAATTS